MSTALASETVTARRRVLVVAPFVPDARAGHGASVAIGGLLEALSRHHDVALIHLRGPEEPAVPDDLAARLAFVREIRRPRRPRGLARRVALGLGLVRGYPMWVQHWWSDDLQRAVRECATDWAADVVQLEMSVMARHLRALRDLPVATVVTVHDPAVQMARDERRRHRGLQWLAHAVDVSAWRRTEKYAVAHADAVVAFTERDAAALRALSTRGNVRVIPLGTHVPAQPCDPVGSGATMLFVGSARHPPNVDAARRLCQDLLPRIVANVPDARLRLVGHHPQLELSAVAERHLDRCGRVSDIRAELELAAVVVAPLHQGGGMRVKVLEALAAGKALVATSLALAGTTAAEDGVAVRADDPAEFVAAVSWLLHDVAARAQMGRRAARWAARELSWDGRAAAYSHLYATLVEPNGPIKPSLGSTRWSANLPASRCDAAQI